MAKLIEVKLDSNLNLKDYEKIQPEIHKKLLEKSKAIVGKTIIHINSTDNGGGVAELLRRQVPFEQAIGIESRWFVISASPAFFSITKKIHNFLQGHSGNLTEEEKKFYLSTNKELGESLKKICGKTDSGIVIVHDPQPLPLVQYIPENFTPILRFHIDLLTPNGTTLDFLHPFISNYAAVILSNQDYCPPLLWFEKSKIKIIPPAIDPFSEKNRAMSLETAQAILKKIQIDFSKPIVTQISRFDPWKDPIGVIDAYFLAKNKIPELQLILVGCMSANDDPEAVSIFEKVKKHTHGDPNIFLLADAKQIDSVSHDKLISAFYTASAIVIQKSIREGFGLTVTEAMWKGKPVIAGNTSGTRLQIKNNENGILVNSPEEASLAIVRLVKDEELKKRLGAAARESVKQNFLLPRFILDNIKVYVSIDAR